MHSTYRLIFFFASSLVITIAQGAPPSGPTNHKRAKLHVISHSEISDALQRFGISGTSRWVERLSDATGLRVTLASDARAVEFRCDGSVIQRQLPGKRTYFDADGQPFAWYVDRTLHFRGSSPDDKIGNQIVVDPNGRFLLTGFRSYSDGPTYMYAVNDLTHPITTVPIEGSRTRIFSTDTDLLVIGDAPGAERGALCVNLEPNSSLSFLSVTFGALWE